MQDKISLAGDLGSGKSTVSKILIERLGAEYYHTGGLVRAAAEKRGMTIGELNVYMETHPEIDKEIDDGLRALSDVDKFLVIDSRMAWHFVEGTFKIYLSTDIETSSIRIMNAKRECEHSATLEQTMIDTRERRVSEKKRYSEKYGVNITDLSNYSLVVDTSFATPDEIADCICTSFERWQADKSYRGVFLSPERINLPEREVDEDAVSVLVAKLEMGENIPLPEVLEENGEFYVADGFDSVMAYTLTFSTFVPCVLVGEGKPSGDFVKMKNSL